MTALDVQILLDSPERYFKCEDVNGIMLDAGPQGENGTHNETDMTQGVDLGLINEVGTGIQYIGAGARSVDSVDRPVYPFAIEGLFFNPIAASAELIIQLGSGQQDGIQITAKAIEGQRFIQSAQYDQANTRTTSSSVVDTSKLTHVVSKHISATSRELYVNGLLDGVNTQSITLGLDDWFIYAGWNGVTSNFTGVLGRIAYYTNYDLTPARILAHYQAALAARGVAARGVAFNIEDLEELVV